MKVHHCIKLVRSKHIMRNVKEGIVTIQLRLNGVKLPEVIEIPYAKWASVNFVDYIDLEDENLYPSKEFYRVHGVDVCERMYRLAYNAIA